jgi:FkbM family methyltransferase
MVRRGMTGATGNIYAGLHEFCDMMVALHLLREGDLFLDIGSNIGSYTILASGVRRAMTWAFEPDPGTVSALKRNIDLNNLSDRVVVHELALGDRDGKIAFTRGLDTTNRVASDGEPSVRWVSLKRLDTLIGGAQPLMIKIDVEGYEEPVIRGSHRLLARESVKVIELEQLTPEIKINLDRFGFELAYYDPFTRSLSDAPNGPPSSNSLFVRDWKFVAARLATAPFVDVLGRSI